MSPTHIFSVNETSDIFCNMKSVSKKVHNRDRSNSAWNWGYCRNHWQCLPKAHISLGVVTVLTSRIRNFKAQINLRYDRLFYHSNELLI